MRIILLTLLLLLSPPLAAKRHPTAECRWLHDRIAILEAAIKQGDTLGTQEELARWRWEYAKKACRQYDY